MEESYRLRDIEQKVKKHHRDLYEGNGRPALTVRMALLEDCVDKINRNLSRLVWLMVATLFGVIAHFFVHGG